MAAFLASILSCIYNSFVTCYFYWSDLKHPSSPWKRSSWMEFSYHLFHSAFSPLRRDTSSVNEALTVISCHVNPPDGLKMLLMVSLTFLHTKKMFLTVFRCWSTGLCFLWGAALHPLRGSPHITSHNPSAWNKRGQITQSASSSSSVPGPPLVPVRLAEIIVRNQICSCTKSAVYHLSPLSPLCRNQKYLPSLLHLIEGVLNAPSCHLIYLLWRDQTQHTRKRERKHHLWSNKTWSFSPHYGCLQRGTENSCHFGRDETITLECLSGKEMLMCSVWAQKIWANKFTASASSILEILTFIFVYRRQIAGYFKGY